MAIVEDTDARIRRVNAEVSDRVDVFNAKLGEYAETISPSLLVKLHRKIVIEALRRVVLKTPVDTGRARGNWIVSVGSIDTSTRDVADPSGDKVISEGRKVLASIGFAQVVWISNSLDYIVFLEDGSSKQAPNGMVKVTLAELEQIFP